MEKTLPVGIVLVLLLLFPFKIIAQNTNPNALNDYTQVCENSGTVTIDVQNNDTDPENNSLTTSIYAGPSHGAASLAGNSINYTPNPNYSGSDTIVYVVCDNGSPSLCDTALLVVTVNPLPIADAESDETICFGDSVQIGTPGAMNVSYAWSPAAGLSATNVPQPLAGPPATTSYIVTATNVTTGCQNRDTMTVTVNPLPPANAGPDYTTCEGDSVQLGSPATPGNTYYWSPIPPLSWNNSPQPMAAPSVTTTFTLTVTTTATGCQNYDSVTVTIIPAPPVNAGPNRTICFGGSVQIGTPAVSGLSYSWSPANGLSATNIAQPLASPTVTTSYTLTVSDGSTGCSDTDIVVVIVDPASVANAGPDRSACDGDSVQIGSPAMTGVSYSWSPAAGLSSTTVAQPMAGPSATTSYTLTITTTGGCTGTDVVVVNVGTSPVADAGADQQLCAGSSITIGTPAVSGNSYSWSPAAGLSSAVVAQPNAQPNTTTSYILTVTQTSSGCQGSDTVIVTVLPLPVADAGPDRSSCSGDSVQIGSVAVAGNTYSWAPAAGLSATNTAQPMAAPLLTTTYTLTVTNTATGCQAADTVTVYVGITPLAAAGPDQAICSGSSTLIGTPAVPGNSYSWSPAAGLSSSTSAQPVANPSVTTTYILTVINTASGCPNSDTVTVAVNPLPVANAGPDQVSCSGDSVRLGAPAVPGYAYAWLPPLGLSSPAVAQPMAAPLIATSYTLIVTDLTTGCQGRDTVVVSIGASPVANAGTDQSVCSGDSVTIGTTVAAGLTYSWSPANGLSASSVAQPNASPAVTTVYTLTVTNAAGCTASDSMIVTVHALPVADAGADQSACSGDSVMIGTAAAAGNSYSWSPAAGLSATNVAQPMASPPAATSYTLTVTNAFGCVNTDVVVVTLSPAPVADAGPDVTICAGDMQTIGTAAVAGNTYTWTPGGGLSASNIAQPQASPAVTTAYVVTVTNSAGCSASDSMIVTVNPAPAANTGPAVSVCNGDSVIIGVTAVPGNTYSWSPADGLSSTTLAQPVASPSVTTTYTLTETAGSCSATNTVTVTVHSIAANAGPDHVACDGSGGTIGSPGIPGLIYQWSPTDGLSAASDPQPTANPGTTITYTLTVTDTATGCTATDEMVFDVSAGGGVYNAFSPNGDGSNDWWHIPLVDCYNDNEVVVVNRWGNEVWRGKNYDNNKVRWDGRNLDGVEVTDGTYYYIITYGNTELRGWVFIKR